MVFCLGLAAARWMYGYQGKGKSLIDSLITLPVVLPPVVTGFFLLLLFGRNSPLGQMLQAVGIRIIFSWSATVITATVVAFPFMYKTSLAAFTQIDPNLIHAARTLGASEWRVFWQILLPLAWPGILSGTILSFTRSLGEFGATVMLAGNIPGQTQTIPIAIFFAAESGDMEGALFWVIIIVAISTCAIVTLNQTETGKINRGRRSKTRVSYLDDDQRQQPGFLRTNDQGQRTNDQGQMVVDIHKPKGNFALETHFTIGNQTLSILGASGAGKSLLLRCIAGLENPQTGRIVINNKIIFDSTEKINLPAHRRRIGLVWQNYALFPHYTVWQNIAFGINQLPRGEKARLVAEKIAQMHLDGLENRYPHQLSGGQQQRVALARALAIEPEVLLLDEPFSALDTHLRYVVEKQVRDILLNYSGVALFVTHNIEEAYRLGDKLLVLDEGRMAAFGDKTDILEHPPNVAVARLMGCKNISRARVVDSQKVEAIDWQCTLSVMEAIPNDITSVGIRAYQIQLPAQPHQENTFPCWLAQTSETPHRMTLYLKLHEPPAHINDYHLQAEIVKAKWIGELKERPFPWYVCLVSIPERGSGVSRCNKVIAF
ncbi:molybdate ABC transporter permease subunit [[Phormidium] sp. ETS-05]|uniref:molybdate ABC transporter permease subunit n=1 Tax=[Phormidium] sp. ETS-05 TaxID=222819 RepID=UPI001E446159|nr:molybdate ABC transporter permease subunit [[Phormidium] sp. ETS-05]